jgi:glucosamine--fructose-6-phosphate aminotransferase (isomerizing)
VVGISASGEVARTLEAIDLAKNVGAYTLGITHDPESSLARNVDGFLTLPTPKLPHGPGLLSYLGSLLMGYALCMAMAPGRDRNLISEAIENLPSELESWISREQSKGFDLAEKIGARENIVFLGAGPDHSSAMFSAAKVVEACGVSSWGQDLEEWAHIEYFSEPASMPTWLLSANGRSYGREIEIEAAAHGIGRQFAISRWGGWKGLDRLLREAISPLVLWVGPVAYAAKLAEILSEESFRGFGGGRNRVEGGGVSRIRSSERIQSLNGLAG